MVLSDYSLECIRKYNPVKGLYNTVFWILGVSLFILAVFLVATYCGHSQINSTNSNSMFAQNIPGYCDIYTNQHDVIYHNVKKSSIYTYTSGYISFTSKSGDIVQTNNYTLDCQPEQ